MEVGHIVTVPDGAGGDGQQVSERHRAPATWQYKPEPLGGLGISQLGASSQPCQLGISEPDTAWGESWYSHGELTGKDSGDSYGADGVDLSHVGDLSGWARMAGQPEAFGICGNEAGQQQQRADN